MFFSRHNEIISHYHTLKTSGQFSVFYGLDADRTLLLTVLNVYNWQRKAAFESAVLEMLKKNF